MPSVLLGNTAPKAPALGLTINQLPETTPLQGKTIVHIDTPDLDADGNLISFDKQLAEVRFAFGIHSDGDVAWVESGDAFFEQALSKSFGCPVGRPGDWDRVASDEDEKAGVGKVSDVELTIEDN